LHNRFENINKHVNTCYNRWIRFELAKICISHNNYYHYYHHYHIIYFMN